MAAMMLTTFLNAIMFENCCILITILQILFLKIQLVQRVDIGSGTDELLFVNSKEDSS